MDQSSNRSSTQQVEGIPELIQNIQSRLPVKAAARTSVLSKSWLKAWSTIPTLRFHHIPTPIIRYEQGAYEEDEINSLQLIDIDHTLDRYLRENIPIETFELFIEIENEDSAYFAKKWLRYLATKTHVKEISLRIKLKCSSYDEEQQSFNLPYVILSNENLTKLRVSVDILGDGSVTMKSSNHPVNIKCVSLRELHLDRMGISQKILDGLLSSCRSLEKVKLSDCSRYLNAIKVKNLPCLYELIIFTDDGDSTDFVISHLPNLHIFSFGVEHGWVNVCSFNSLSISLGSSVTQLKLIDLAIDNKSLDMIKAGSPFLESLTLDMTFWNLGSFNFTCASIKSLFLLSCPSRLIDIQIHAPKLSHFQFDGYELPSLLFPVSSTLKELNFWLKIDMHVDASFFLKLREALTLSRKCHLRIETYNCKVPLDIDMNKLKLRLLLPPARNVKLWFKTDKDECRWTRSPFFDAFFEICHPEQVFAIPDSTFSHSNHFCRLMLKEVLEKKKTGPTVYWPRYLEHVQIDPTELSHENWETLTNSHRSLLDGSTPRVYMYFKLKWR